MIAGLMPLITYLRACCCHAAAITYCRQALQSVSGDVVIRGMDKLTNVNALGGLTQVGGELFLKDLPLLTSTRPLANVTQVGEPGCSGCT